MEKADPPVHALAEQQTLRVEAQGGLLSIRTISASLATLCVHAFFLFSSLLAGS